MIGILLVHGHPYIVKMLKTQIELESDMRIIGEISGDIPVEKISLHSDPDVIVNDIDTPDMDGLEITRSLRRIFPNTPLILLSMSDDEALRNEYLSAGGTRFIAKESDTGDFLAAIREATKG